jgi:shikimate dehydrogenase
VHADGARRAAVLGSPIAHSLSPTLHRAAYAGLGLGWRYDALEVDADGLSGFLRACGPEWVGLSLTMPLKRAVLPLLDTATDLVRLVGAANTVVFGPGGAAGHNTDVAGIVAALRGIEAQPGPALVLGGGATAASALAALAQLGCPSVVVRARRPEVVSGLADVAATLGVELTAAGWPGAHEPLPDRGVATIVVSTVPGAAAARLGGAVPQDPGALLDVSYAPWPSALVSAWRAGGGAAASGEEMLLHQAVAQVELMTGRVPDVTAMRSALHDELRRRAARETRSGD